MNERGACRCPRVAPPRSSSPLRCRSRFARVTSWWIFGAVLAVVVVAVVADFIAAASPDGIVVQRRFPTSITLGESGQLRWIVENHTGRTVRTTVADAIWPSLDASRRASTFTVGVDGVHRFGATIEPPAPWSVPVRSAHREGDRAAGADAPPTDPVGSGHACSAPGPPVLPTSCAPA